MMAASGVGRGLQESEGAAKMHKCTKPEQIKETSVHLLFDVDGSKIDKHRGQPMQNTTENVKHNGK
jgi:hypothetical protein